jgi:hypothetical protein
MDLLSLNIKISEVFNIYVQVKDYQGFLKNPLTYIFQGFYSLDAVSSGTQILAMCLRSYKLRQMCGFVQDFKDLYQTVVDYWNHIFKLIEKMLSQISEQFRDIIDSLKNELENATKLHFDAQKTKYIHVPSKPEKLRIIYVRATDKIFKLPKLKEQYDNIYKNYMNIRNFLLSRNSSKTIYMTDQYGSSVKGKTNQCKKNFIKYCYINGIILKNTDMLDLKTFAPSCYVFLSIG